MRPTHLVLATALGLAGVAAAADARAPGGTSAWGPGGSAPMEQMFETFDRDGDGRLTQAEIDAYRGERHAAFDANGDGVLDLPEFQALWADAMRQPMVRRFQALDADGDGHVTAEEFQAPFARILDRVPTAEGGVLTRDDLRQLRRDRDARRAEMRGWHRGTGPMGDGPMGGAGYAAQ